MYVQPVFGGKHQEPCNLSPTARPCPHPLQTFCCAAQQAEAVLLVTWSDAALEPHFALWPIPLIMVMSQSLLYPSSFQSWGLDQSGCILIPLSLTNLALLNGGGCLRSHAHSQASMLSKPVSTLHHPSLMGLFKPLLFVPPPVVAVTSRPLQDQYTQTSSPYMSGFFKFSGLTELVSLEIDLF